MEGNDSAPPPDEQQEEETQEEFSEDECDSAITELLSRLAECESRIAELESQLASAHERIDGHESRNRHEPLPDPNAMGEPLPIERHWYFRRIAADNG